MKNKNSRNPFYQNTFNKNVSEVRSLNVTLTSDSLHVTGESKQEERIAIKFYKTRV